MDEEIREEIYGLFAQGCTARDVRSHVGLPMHEQIVFRVFLTVMVAEPVGDPGPEPVTKPVGEP